MSNESFSPPLPTLKTIRASLVPLFGIQWNKQVICGLTTNRFNDILRKLRNRGLDSATCDELAAFRQDSCTASTARSPEWSLWIPPIRRSRLQDRFSWPSLYESLPPLRRMGYSATENLALLPDAVFGSTFPGTPRLSEARALWGSARFVFSKQAIEGSQPSSAFCFASDTFATAVKAAAKRAKVASTSLAHDDRPLNLNPTFGKLGPSPKLTLLKKRTPPRRALSHLITARAQLNLIKQIKGSLPSVASAIRCYTSFFELISARPFPQPRKRSFGGAVFSTTPLHTETTSGASELRVLLPLGDGLASPRCSPHCTRAGQVPKQEFPIPEFYPHPLGGADRRIR